jgi:small GTP-binding protein
MLGDSGVGKTSLVARLTNPDRPMNHDISATMGIEFDTQMLDTEHGKVKAQIWDTAGQERFARVLLPTYFRKAKGVILVYDITNAKSFESLSERWMTQLNDHASSDDLAKLLVGNKNDLEASREVSREKAERFCAEFGMDMLETSAKSGENVLKAFEKLIGIVHNKALETSSKHKGGIRGMNGGNDGFQLDNGESKTANDGACGC